MTDLEIKINENMQKVWQPANVGVIDETLVPHKG